MPRKAKPKPPANPGRPDLNQTQPIRTPTGMGYGENIKLETAQQAAPLPQTPPVQAATPGQAPGDFGQVLAAARGMQFPGQTIGDPSNMENETVTTGLPVGPGAGPEVMNRQPGAPSVAQTLARLAYETGDPELTAMAQLAEAQGA